MTFLRQNIFGSEQSDLLLHFDGPNGSTNFVDSSNNKIQVNVAGTASISNEQSKFGGTSLKLSGANTDYIWVDTVDKFNFRRGYTVECWFWHDSTQVSNWFPIFGFYDPLYTGTNGTDGPLVFLNNSATTMHCLFNQKGGGSGWTYNSNFAVSVNDSWHHIAITDTGSYVRIYLDGVLKLSTRSNGKTGVGTRMSIGRWGNYAEAPGAFGFKGYIDEFRVASFAKYTTSSFIPPTQPYIM